MEQWKQRLTQARIAKGLSKTALARAAEVSNATITDWEKSVETGGIKEISGPNLARICRILEVDPMWLMQGSGSAGATPPASHSVSDEELQRLLPGAMRVHAVDDDDPTLTHIPKVKLRLSAGITGFEVEPERFDGSTTTVPTNWMERNGYSRNKLIAITVKGESMEPTLYEGDLVVINTADVNLVDGAVYAVNYEGDAVVKRLTRDAGQWWLTSDNPDQRRYYRRSCVGNECIVVGRVVRKESERL